jgi:hypothetical protein
VLGWEDLRSLIAEYPEVMEKHYRDQAPTARRTLGLIEDLKTSSELRGELHGAALQLIGSKLDVLIGRGATPA